MFEDLTDEQREIRDLARRFSDEIVAPRAADWDREQRFPREVANQLGELGLMGVCVPEDLGGAGADFLSYVLVIEEISRGDAGLGVTLAVHTSAGTLPIVAYGTRDQAERVVPPLAQGHELAAFALTESGAGSDAGAIRTRAADERITGTKQWVTNGGHAHTRPRLRPRRGRPDLGLPRPPRRAQGMAVAREEDKMGLHSSSTADLTFDDTPAERLGEPRVAGSASRSARSTPGGSGSRRRRSGSRRRRSTSRSPTRRSATRSACRSARTARSSRRSPTWRPRSRPRGRSSGAPRGAKQAGAPHKVEGAQAKLFASGVARRVTGEAIQVLGGYGYTTSFPAERFYRDAKITEIYEGTSEIQRLVIARSLLGDAARPAG